ncbi:N-formylglutamate amidohydrolase [Methyloterricola oryzae]|uniref:N-formylglutamate amidohydrolase n=1 Tax=Methyloterricola oryzae TaxID=1495050 RepID=UPI0005EACF7E|nr:N-formylglutamate amidohydrolase [Methyloterricola oryzae]
MDDLLVFSCEHGGNRIPAQFRPLFGAEADRDLLQSHRGFDLGALALARDFARAFESPIFASTVSRLLIDLNRSLTNPRIHSPMVRHAPKAVRRRIEESYYWPYRRRVEKFMQSGIADGRRIIHISCHSFCPELDGKVRNADIGLLYDPAKTHELDFCRRWQASLSEYAPELKVRRNYPYAGKNDGFTTHLRRCFPSNAYIGIELEVNQRHSMKAKDDWAGLRGQLVESLLTVLAGPFGQTRVSG